MRQEESAVSALFAHWTPLLASGKVRPPSFLQLLSREQEGLAGANAGLIVGGIMLLVVVGSCAAYGFTKGAAKPKALAEPGAAPKPEVSDENSAQEAAAKAKAKEAEEKAKQEKARQER